MQLVEAEQLAVAPDVLQDGADLYIGEQEYRAQLLRIGVVQVDRIQVPVGEQFEEVAQIGLTAQLFRSGFDALLDHVLGHTIHLRAHRDAQH